MRTWIARNPEAHQGRVVGNGHCVAFVREACGLGHTSTWRKGVLARGAALPAGTAIATFSTGPDGRYENRADGASHVAVLIAETAAGLHSLWVANGAATRSEADDPLQGRRRHREQRWRSRYDALL